MSLNGDGAHSPEGANDADGRDALCEEEAAHPATACEDHCCDVPADDDFADQPQHMRRFLHARRLAGLGRWQEAHSSYTAAAELQHGPSLAALAVLRARGWGALSADIDAAFNHARAGCDLQCEDSMGALALCYMLHAGQHDDELMDKVVAMATESAAAGSATGSTVLGCMLSNGWHTLPADQSAAAAAFLRSASAVYPCADGAYRYSVCCNLGLGVPMNVCAALEYLRLSASLGHPDALYDMAGLLMKGVVGVAKDEDAAVSMLSHAADQGHVAACVALAGVISKGHMFDLYNDRASQLIVTAATRGSALAQTVVGRLHETGHSLFSFLETQAERERRAVVWYTRASDQGYVEAQALLGGLLIAAKWSRSEEHAEARRLLQVAASKGHATSIAILSALDGATRISRKSS